MRFAFAIFKYFPFGGLQRDMLRIALEAASRGHKVTVFTARWEGNRPDGIDIRILPWRGMSNHAASCRFAEAFKSAVANGNFDRVVIFNRMEADADFYFAADDCQAEVLGRRHCRLMLKIHPRYRTFLRQERAVFSPGVKTRIWYIAPQQKKSFQQHYGTEQERFFYLPPGMNPGCRRPEEAQAWAIRRDMRQKLGIGEEDIAVIMVAGQFHLKGGDRMLHAVASLPEELRRRIKVLWAGGGSDALCRKLSRKLHLDDQVIVLGPRDDVPELLLAADIMVHPARFESAGSVLIEAIAAGVPVITSAACGFAGFVADIDASLVTQEPFEQQQLNRTLQQALGKVSVLTAKTIAYAENADFYSRAARAVDMLEEERW